MADGALSAMAIGYYMNRTTTGTAALLGWSSVLLLLLTAVGVGRIVSTYRVFSATYDEPVHIMSGIEWLQFGRLTVNRMHPPLSRVFVALGPYLDGVRWQGKDYYKTEAIAELHSQGHYWRTLALARDRRVAVLRAGGVGDVVAGPETLRTGCGVAAAGALSCCRRF